MTTKYPREDRYKAAVAYVATGNSLAASRESGIPGSTIRHWLKADDDFQLICEEIRSEFGERMKYQFAEIIMESGEQALDRLRNGDVVRDSKTGELHRVPIKGKDAAIIGAVAFDKLRLAENQPTSIVQHGDSKERLLSLVDQFNVIGKANRRGDDAEAERLILKIGGTPMVCKKSDEDL